MRVWSEDGVMRCSGGRGGGESDCVEEIAVLGEPKLREWWCKA